MTVPLSIRFSTPLLERLRHRAQAMTGASVACLAQRLIDEGLRMADHPGVIFKEGPTGRRAALAYGPDVWEVIKFLREVGECERLPPDPATSLARRCAPVRRALYQQPHLPQVQEESGTLDQIRACLVHRGAARTVSH